MPRRWRRLLVGVGLVVEDLILRTGQVRRAAVGRDPIHDAAVRSFADLPFERELEVAIVANLRSARQMCLQRRGYFYRVDEQVGGVLLEEEIRRW